MLRTKDLSRSPIIKDINLVLPPAQLIALLGPNGAGKTTLIKVLAGLTPATSGTVTLQSNNITAWETHQRVANGIVYLPQQAALFASLSVAENLRVVFDYHPYWHNKDEAEFMQQSEELLNRVGLAGIQDRIAGVLSGGQKRQLEVARALLMQPKVLLCDEPFAGVDPKSITELTELFTTLAHRDGMSILLSDHNVTQLLAHADYAYLMLNGSIVAHGTSEQVRTNAITREQYLGERF